MYIPNHQKKQFHDKFFMSDNIFVNTHNSNKIFIESPKNIQTHQKNHVQ